MRVKGSVAEVGSAWNDPKLYELAGTIQEIAGGSSKAIHAGEDTMAAIKLFADAAGESV